MKGLTRIDHDGKKMYGWLVRAYGGGKTFSKYFSDRKHGGKEQSKMIAIEYLKKLEAEIAERFKDYKPRQNQPLYRRKPGKGNRTGVVGIHRCETVNHGKQVFYWAATWNEDGRPKDKKFYFGKDTRTEDEAKLLAMEWRALKIIELAPESIGPLSKWLSREIKQYKTHRKPRKALRGWVPGLEIDEWGPASLEELEMDPENDLKIKKREPLNEKRILELVRFMGIAAALYDWKDIDYDFGRGIFVNDVRSRCFWNKSGIRTTVLIDENGKLLFIQDTEPDPYYLAEKEASQQQSNVG